MKELLEDVLKVISRARDFETAVRSAVMDARLRDQDRGAVVRGVLAQGSNLIDYSVTIARVEQRLQSLEK